MPTPNQAASRRPVYLGLADFRLAGSLPKPPITRLAVYLQQIEAASQGRLFILRLPLAIARVSGNLQIPLIEHPP